LAFWNVVLIQGLSTAAFTCCGYFCTLMSSPSETICALSTAPGIGAIALIRLSGQNAEAIVQPYFSRDLSKKESHQSVHGWLKSGEELIDDVVVTVYRAPRSFTGENTVEIACHGSAYVQQRILELLLNAGARMAQPGEFTMRAFLNGRMDLSQAEAVGDLIASESAAAHKQALHQMRGGFSKEINQLRERLVHFASMVELELDFAEEDVEFANRDQLTKLVVEILGVVDSLKESFKLGNALKNGVPVAILGAPNAGKSTLLNALLNEERAIVSDIAGTTRDTIEDHITLGGIRFNFIDTAGIRQTIDTIEKIGIGRAFEKAKTASVLLLLFDATMTTYEEYRLFRNQLEAEAGEEKLIISLANKTDLPAFEETNFAINFSDVENLILISAKSRHHIDDLKEALMRCVNIGRINSGETIVTNARHHEALSKASVSLNEILRGIENGITGDFLAIDIRKTIFHLAEITGEINADDLLHNIFSKFCIGK
jgi:tRNA modification GTPase